MPSSSNTEAAAAAPDAQFQQLPQGAREEFEKAAEFSINATKCVVDDVEFVGNVRTRASFLRKQFASTMAARSLRDIVVSSRDCVQGLKDLGMFHSVEAKILLADADADAAKEPGTARARVQVHVHEKRIFKLRATGSLGGAAGSGGAEATVGNALGVADIIAGHAEYLPRSCCQAHNCNALRRYGSSHSSAFTCALTLPRPPLLPTPIKLQLQRAVVNEMQAQSFESTVHGVALSLLPRDLSLHSSATLSCDLRTLTARAHSLCQALPARSLKLALTLNHARHDTDDKCAPRLHTLLLLLLLASACNPRQVRPVLRLVARDER
jgi:hypothetical protein